MEELSRTQIVQNVLMTSQKYVLSQPCPIFFINRAIIRDKKSWRASFGFKNKNVRRIASYNHIKGVFSSIETTFWGSAGILKQTLVGKKYLRALGWATPTPPNYFKKAIAPPPPTPRPPSF